MNAVTGATRELPDGWVLVPADVDPDRVERLEPGQVLVPSRVPGCRQAHQPAWRTAAAAEAARVSGGNADRWRVQWVPVVPDPDVRGHVMLGMDTWRGIGGGPIVIARDHFAEHPWKPGESRLHLLAAPSEGDRIQIHADYQPLLADQPGLAQVPPEWIHLTLCALPAACNAAEEADTAARLAETLRDRTRHVWPIPPLRLVVGPATINAHGVQLDLRDSGVISPAVRTAEGELLGYFTRFVTAEAGVAAPGPFWRPHLAIAYTHNTGAPGHALIDGTGLNHERRRWEWLLTELHIAAVTQDATAGHYRWRVLHTVHVPVNDPRPYTPTLPFGGAPNITG